MKRVWESGEADSRKTMARFDPGKSASSRSIMFSSTACFSSRYRAFSLYRKATMSSGGTPQWAAEPGTTVITSTFPTPSGAWWSAWVGSLREALVM